MKQKCQCPERARGGEEGGAGRGGFKLLLLLVRLEVGGMACMMGTEFIDVT